MISVIVPLYNKKDGIEKCIRSVFEQSFKDWELIIIDDGSTDGSASIVQLYLYDNRIKYFYKNNGGVSSARNWGISKSNGEWIIFIDADDYFLPDALGVLYSLTQEMNVKISAANFYREKEGRKIKACFGERKKILKNNLKSYFFCEFSLRAGTALFHKEVLSGMSFDESLTRYEDLKFIIEIMKKTRIAYDPKCVMTYSLDNLGLSHGCKNVNNDFIFNMQFENKSFWEKIILGNLLWMGCNTYNEYVKDLRIKYNRYWIYKYFSKCFNLYTRMKSLMRKINLST